MSITRPVSNNASISLYQPANKWTIVLNPDNNMYHLSVEFGRLLRFQLQAYSYDQLYQTFSIVTEPGDLVAGMAVSLYDVDNQGYVVMDTTGLALGKVTPPSSFSACQIGSDGRYTSSYLWSFIATDCEVGSNVLYRNNYFIQNAGLKTCSLQGRYNGFIHERLDYFLNVNLVDEACPASTDESYIWSIVSNVLEGRASMLSGYYVNFYNQPQSIVALTSSQNNAPYELSTTLPNGTNMTRLLIKKFNLETGQFYLSTDPEATIYPGDLVCFFNTPDVSSNSPTGNGLMFGSSGTLINSIDNVVMNTTTNSALWTFVELDGTGNLSSGGVGDLPVAYGKNYYLQSYGVFTSSGGYGYWSSDGGLGVKTISEPYPSSLQSYQFFMLTDNGMINFGNGAPAINNCINCSNSECNNSCCGCDTPSPPSQTQTQTWNWVLILIIVIVIIVIIIALIFLVYMMVKTSSTSDLSR